MNRKKTPTPERLEVNLAMAVLFGGAMLGQCAKEAGVGADHPALREAVNKLGEDLKRQYDRKLAAQALRERKRWRKADLPRLAQLLLLPGLASGKTQRRIAELIEDKNSSGHGVIPKPKKFDQALVDSFAVWERIVNRATSPKERRELRKENMPKYPALIEAAYRAELQKAQLSKTDRTLPHLKASEIAEDRVAEAAGISRAVVHRLCQLVRDEREGALKWVAARPGLRWVEPEPTISAADLKRHLESGPG